MSTYTIEYETELTAPAVADEMLIFDTSAYRTKKIGIDTLRAFMSSGVVNVTASTLTVTGLEHAGQTVTINRAAGCTVTLPAATGTGYRYRFYVGTTITSNNLVIQVADATDVMAGACWFAQDGGDTVVAFETASTSDTITMNGSTTGGIKGTIIDLIDVASNEYSVQIFGSATGAEATPFSAAVS